MKKEKKSIVKTNSNHKRIENKKSVSLITKTNPQSTFDFYRTYTPLIEKHFRDLEKSIPRYYKATMVFQLEFIQICGNFLKLYGFPQKEEIIHLDSKIVSNNESVEFISKSFENLLKINALKLESYVLSLESFTGIILEWNSLLGSYVNTFKKIYSQN